MSAPAVAHARHDEFREFAAANVAPAAAGADRDGTLPDEVVLALARAGYLTAAVGAEFGGGGFDHTTFGALCEEVGRACTATRSLLTVQNMVGRAIERWGSPAQRERWLPAMASGSVVAGLCVTEPGVGSDAKSVTTAVVDRGGEVAVTGEKRWVTFGARADLFLVLGRAAEGPTACLVERAAPGVSVSPVRGQLGLRGAMLADVTFTGAPVAADAVLGKAGWGFSHVISTALDDGRFSVAWGCVGMAQAALDATVDHALGREQFGAPIADHQLVRGMVADMLVDVTAARLLCLDAAARRDRRDPGALHATMIAKYRAARAAAQVTRDAVQLHGAAGVDPQRGVERLFRDAKVMEIIEGTNEILRLAISEVAYRAGR